MTIDWATRVIHITQAELSLVSGNYGVDGSIFQLDLNAFRKGLKAIEDNEDGIVNPDTHRHNTTVILDGIEYARIIEIINGYTVTFEDGKYAVNLVGANSNVGTVSNVNQVSIRVSNSAGLIVVQGGGSTGSCDEADIHDALDSYPNKDDYKASPDEVAVKVWDYTI